jgi:ubiquinone/menaquinone biosynthesis C-methylase UbiE
MSPEVWSIYRNDPEVCLKAFHWCLDYEAAAAEFARVLKPNGALSLIWNHEDR